MNVTRDMTRSVTQQLNARCFLAGMGLLAIGVVCAALALVTWMEPKRFGVVDGGRLYRSGLITPGHLVRLKRDYGVTRVISFLDPEAPESLAEQQACRSLGIEYQNVPMRGNGDSTPSDRARILELLSEEAGPTVMHCAAGANRTGLATGLYRIEFQDWPFDRVITELRKYGFENKPKHANMREALMQAASRTHGAGQEDCPP